MVKEPKRRLWPGRLMLAAAILFMAGAAFVARSGGRLGGDLLAMGIMWFCLGTFSLWRTR